MHNTNVLHTLVNGNIAVQLTVCFQRAVCAGNMRHPIIPDTIANPFLGL